VQIIITNVKRIDVLCNKTKQYLSLSCVLPLCLSKQSKYACNLVIKYHLKIINVLPKYSFVHDIFYTSNPQTNTTIAFNNI